MSLSNLLSESERAFQRECEALVGDVVAPHADDIDRNDEVPAEVFAALHPKSVLTVPEQYGGGGKHEIHACLFVEQIGRVCPALVPYIEIGQLFSKAIEIGGDKAQKERYLGRVCAGEVGAYALTDAEAGSDPSTMTTRAEKKGDGWVLHGRKRHITYYDMADMMVVFAQDGDGLGAFMLEKPFEGITVERRSEWNGLRGHKAYNFTLQAAPAACRIGGPGEGLKIALKVLNHTRISLAFGHVGLASRALELATAFAKERQLRGKPLARQQGIAFPLIEVFTQIEGARLLALRAARMADAGASHRAETAMAKLAATEAMLQSVTTCSRTLGGYGCNLDYPAERFVRDAYSWAAAQGTIEIQKLTVGRQLFS